MKTRRKYGGTKTMNCHPSVEGKTVGPDTCYTKPAVDAIVAGYNKTAKKKARTLNDVKQNVKCSREDCLLKFVEDAKKIDSTHFAPDMPEEWLSDPDAWLSNYDIAAVTKQYETVYPEFYSLEPTTIDFAKKQGETCVSEELCRFSLKDQMARGKRKFGLVINTDVSTGYGKHWISLYFDVDNKYMFFFDSAGESYIPGEISEFMTQIKDQAKALGIKMSVYHNCKIRHQSSGSECGMYSLFFIITQLTGKVPYESRKYGIRERIQMFRKKRIPDSVVFKFRKLYFNQP